MTSSTLVMTVDVDGLQHGKEAFTPKCLALFCDRIEGSYSWTFDTSHLLSRPVPNLATCKFQTEHLHGLTLTSPGMPPALFPTVLAHTLVDMLLECLASTVPTRRPRCILMFLKGHAKIPILQKALEACRLPVPVTIRNLEDMGCPTVPKLCPELNNQIFSTQFKANEYSIWLADQGI